MVKETKQFADSGDHFVVICSPPPVGYCISSHDSLLQHVFLYFLPGCKGICSRTEVDKFKESPSLVVELTRIAMKQNGHDPHLSPFFFKHHGILHDPWRHLQAEKIRGFRGSPRRGSPR